MRTPRLRRFGAWLAIFALTVHTLAMAAHQPAFGAATAFPIDPHAICIAGDSAADQGEAPEEPGNHHSNQTGSPCPICQRLAALDSYLPVLLAVLTVPSQQPVALAPDGTPVEPPRLALTSLNPRGPPPLA